ncbi:prolargin [Amia ocellicauda]|uniref:prolargin n=1 Tax=Amia ocellicauda TaxID=2972642 RepID=UPI0034648F64|nr:PRELP protein [Amia calva]
MRARLGLFLLLSLLLIAAVWGQAPKPRPRKPGGTRRPTATRPQPVEPAEPTDFPPPILGPPSNIPGCPRECFCPPSFPSALYCDGRNLRKIPIIPAWAHYLYLQNNYIDEVTVESFKNATELKWVNLDNNRIRRVDRQLFDKLPNLLFLYMERNNLKEVPNDLPPNLEQLRLSRNQISKIPPGVFNKMEHLVLLDLHHNKLGDSDLGKNIFKGLKNLVQLNLAHNILRKMPPNVPHNIFQLFLDRNNIEDIPQGYFKDFHNLAFVRLNNNQLTDKGVPKTVFNVSSLLDLHLAYNKLSNVPVFNLQLEQLYLNNNNIEKINGTEICPFPVMSMSMSMNDEDAMPRLRYLRLDGNALKPPIPMDLIMCFRHLKSIVM